MFYDILAQVLAGWFADTYVSADEFWLASFYSRVHFFGKIQNRIIAWDYTDSFLRKIKKIRKGINRGLIPAKETKNPKTGFPSIQIVACFSAKTAYHMDFFRILSQRNTKVVNPKNPDSD